MIMPEPEQAQQSAPMLYFVLSPYFAGQGRESEQERSAFFEAFATLPEKLQQCIVAGETAEVIGELGDALNLRLTQVEEIALALRDVILGTLSLRDFPQRIVEHASVTPEAGRTIANTLAEKLLVPIKDELVRVQQRTLRKPHTVPMGPQTTSPLAPSTPNRQTFPGQSTVPQHIIDLRTKQESQS